MKQQSHTNRAIPATEFRCVWMLAGVLSYQLCDHDFDCDECPLDAAMRKQFPAPHARSKNASTRLKHAVGFLYTRNHCWIKPVADDLVRIGIGPDLADLLISPKEVVLPQPGSTLAKGTTCVWIVLDGGTFPVRSPLDGIVHSINPSVIDQPHECQQHPLTSGWLFEMKPLNNVIAAAFLSQHEADQFYTDDLDKFRCMLMAKCGPPHPEVGRTLPDGGRTIRDINALIGPEEYLQILRDVFRDIPTDFQI